ncbi:MAG TPA: hypothetical protein VK041_09700 [Opitutales bacterium]|nr:hypothetical protein [Opitutales bacterium]
MKMPTKDRLGFLLTNGSGCYIVDKEVKNEIDERLSEGWRIAFIKPICVSTAVKLHNLPPNVLKDRIFSYSLCVLEKNKFSKSVKNT